MPAHSAYLLESLDAALFSPLKRAYGDQINLFIKASINHITKSELFVVFQAAHDKSFKRDNMISGFRGASLEPLDLGAVNSKLDIQIGTPERLSSRLSTSHKWESQIPSTHQ